MDFNEKLIEYVRKHTSLYETSDKNYKNVLLKNKIWQDIADELNENSDTLKKKWKSLRDGYIKYKKQIKGTTGSERKTIKFMWSAQLSFLDNSISPKETASNVSERSETQTFAIPSPSQSVSMSSSTNNENSAPNSSQYSTQPVPHTTPSNQPIEPTITSRRIRKRIEEPDVDEMIKNYLETKKEKSNHHDAVDYLFLSYAQTFKKLSQRKQALLKVDLAKLFCEAELSDMTSRYSDTSSPGYNESSVSENMNTIYSQNAPCANIRSPNVTEENNNVVHTLSKTLLTAKLPSTSINICSPNVTEQIENMPLNLSNTLLTDLPSTSINIRSPTATEGIDNMPHNLSNILLTELPSTSFDFSTYN